MQDRNTEKYILPLASIFYLFFALVAFIWIRVVDAGEVLVLQLSRPYLHYEIGIIGVTFLLNALFLIYGPRRLPAVKRLFTTLSRGLGPLKAVEAAALAFVSAFGEELLFRGAIQESFGIVVATLLFALSHFPVRKEMIVWPFYALAMGTLLGLLRMLGGDIWTAILLHFLVNLFGLLHIAKSIASDGFSTQNASATEGPPEDRSGEKRKDPSNEDDGNSS